MFAGGSVEWRGNDGDEKKARTYDLPMMRAAAPDIQSRKGGAKKKRKKRKKRKRQD